MINLNNSLEVLKKKVEKIPFLLPFLFLAVYFWINGSAHFENWSNTYGTTILYYIGMMFVFFLWATRKTEKYIDEPLSSSIRKYVVCLIATIIIMILLGYTQVFDFGRISPDILWPTLIIQMCVVSVAEELMFRGVILEYTGVIFSSFLFAIFHSAAYGMRWYNVSLDSPWGSLAFAFIFGLILAFLVKYKPKTVGLPGAVAIHFVYNAFVLGIFSGALT